MAAAAKSFDYRPKSEAVRREFENREYIQSILNRPSGHHTINSERGSLWVAAQLGPYRRDLAKKLLENTRYVKHKNFLEEIRRVISELYGKEKLQDDKPHFWIIDKPNKSGYWIQAMAYYFLPAQYKSKVHFVRLEDFKEFLNDPALQTARLFYIDDMSYSGSQFDQFFSNIMKHNFLEKNNNYYRTYTRRKSNNDPELIKIKEPHIFSYQKKFTNAKAKFIQANARNFWFVPIFITRHAYNKFTGNLRINGGKLKNGFTYPLNVFPGQIVESLYGDGKMTLQEFVDCCTLFNPGAHYQTTVSIYFDHKLADSTSTFMKVIEYGVVPPSNIQFIKEYGEGALPELKYRFPELNLEQEQEKGRLTSVLRKDILDENKTDITVTKFIPFLNNCLPRIPQFWRKLPYEYIIFGDDFRNEYNKGLRKNLKKKLNRELRENENPSLPLININSPEERCPITWYKRRGGRRTIKRTRTRKQ